MIGRALSALLVILLGWLIGRLFRGMRSAPRQPGGAARPSRTTDGAMVRDRVCNTFIPRERALSARVEGREHFFCSDRCRREFLAEREIA